jgi:hypothetical protein
MLMRHARIVLFGCCSLIATSTAYAQDTGHVGLTMGYPSAVGVLWQVSERVALRPEFSFTWTENASQSLVDATSDFSSVGANLSVLFFSRIRDNLKTYVSPRFAYTRTSGSSEVSRSTADMYSVGGLFGAHCGLGQRFAVFGEVGLAYTHQTGSVTSAISPAISTSNHGDSVGTRTGVGVVLYF